MKQALALLAVMTFGVEKTQKILNRVL